MPVNIDLSKQIAKAVNAEARACFRNAALGQQVLGGSALYCEGYALQRDLPIPIEHAWIEFDEEVIDPTWRNADLANNIYVATEKYSVEQMQEFAGQGEGITFPVVIFHAEDRGAASRKHHLESLNKVLAIFKGEE